MLILFPFIKIFSILLLWILLFSSFEISNNLGVFKPLKKIRFAVRTTSVNGDNFILIPVLPKIVSMAVINNKRLYSLV